MSFANNVNVNNRFSLQRYNQSFHPWIWSCFVLWRGARFQTCKNIPVNVSSLQFFYKEALTMIHLKTQTVAIPEQGPSVFSHKIENPPWISQLLLKAHELHAKHTSIRPQHVDLAWSLTTWHLVKRKVVWWFWHLRLGERVGYLEKVLGESAEKHMQATMMTRLEDKRRQNSGTYPRKLSCCLTACP